MTKDTPDPETSPEERATARAVAGMALAEAVGGAMTAVAGAAGPVGSCGPSEAASAAGMDGAADAGAPQRADASRNAADPELRDADGKPA